MSVITTTDLNGLKLAGRGKVRDIYDLGEELLIVTTDRISAFDVIMPNGIPGKGQVLTQLSAFWFEKLSHIVENHLITTDVDKMPEEVQKHSDILKGRTMLVKKARPMPVECVARGYITGSGWKDYKATGRICGIKLASGLIESQKLAEPIFTPATKEEMGAHDENISFEKMAEIIGGEDAAVLRDLTLRIYKFASELAISKGIIIADTKFEFGKFDGKLIQIDEALTPDSSRFWRASIYKEGEPQDSMDKQVVRDYLESIPWNKAAPGPILPDHIVKKAAERYQEIADILTN